MAVIETRYADDEHLEVVVDGEVVAEANHDSHGWDGIAAVEAAVKGIAKRVSHGIALRVVALEHSVTLTRIHVGANGGSVVTNGVIEEAKRIEQYLEKGE